ncbi:MAG TPA: hypothetical protein VJJ52_02215 [Candidatus Nanoarchaeia archaeon]|nr:hypothetical protein [Candidatus Nanoarchaeia archaeon]
MPIDKKEFAKLSPEERIRRLKLLEEERKKDATEIGQLIKQSMQELKTDRLAEEITPERKAVDISRLFEKESGGKLEKTARQSNNAAAGNYQTITQVYQAYSQLREFYGIVAGGSNLTQDQLKAIGQIGEKLNVAEKYMTESERTASKLNASKAVLYKLKKETGLE